MTRSKAFSKHQKERKEELLKKYGCYVLKDIKGDITVNNPKNYKIEYEEDNGEIRSISPKQMKTVQSVCNIKHNQLLEVIERCGKKDEKIFRLEADIVSCEGTLDLTESIYNNVMKMKKSGNIFQKILLRILGL